MSDDDDVKRRMEAVAELTALYQAAFAAGDLAKAEQLSSLMRMFADDSPVNQEFEKVGRGERLILAEKWAEARDVLASVDRAELPAFNRPGVLNNLAYSTAQAGDPERAIPLILQALEEADTTADYPAEKKQYMRATHAIALSLAGKHAEAVAILEPLVKIEKPIRVRSIRAYFLGQSYRALGRESDAKRAYELSAAGEGPFAKRSEDALIQLARGR